MKSGLINDKSTWHIDSYLVHGGSGMDLSGVRTTNPPIFQTSNFMYEDVESGTEILVGQRPGYIYSRYSNPTIDALNRVMADIEEGEAALSFSSGMSAISTSTLAFCKPGDHIVASSLIYGGTYYLLKVHLKRLGIKTTFVNPTRLSEVKESIQPNTRILYTEPLSNPNLISSDISAWADIAHNHNCKLFVDNTFTPPPIFQPLKKGADVVLHSATKYLGGHSDLIGGVVVANSDNIETIYQHLKYHGGIISPFVAWLLLRGIRTLGVRLKKQCENALQIAQFLESHPKVKKVNYAGLTSNPQYKFNRNCFQGFSGMLSFEIKGGFEAAKKFMSKLRLIKFTVSLGDVASLVSHPASTSHIYLEPHEREKIGVTDGLIRLSIGIESLDDLIEDLKTAFSD